jgi:alkaline phosphatase
MCKCPFIPLAVLLTFTVLFVPDAMAVHGAKNIILMIADGGGFNQFAAASYYQYGDLGHQTYDGADWVKYGCTTFSSSGSYDSLQMWSDFTWQQSGATDSSAAATAINTGIKTYDGAVNVDDYGQPLTALAQIANARGRATGTVTTVPISHATPACVWAHNIDRNNYAAIANEMIYNWGLDVIIGAGNPDFDDNGQAASMTSQYVGGSTTWNLLKNGTMGMGWTLIETKADFENYAANPAIVPSRLIGIAQVNTTLQERRSGGLPLNTNVPSLATMSRAAINVLSKDPDGFYVMIEGGAVDWANHESNLNRMIEEQTDFNLAVKSVVNWIETNSSWNETLLIVTADHESGCLWGPDSGDTTFGDIVNNGVGVLPDAIYYTGSHTNQLVPLYARGVGSELFAAHVDGTDADAASHYGISGQYIDDTAIFEVMNAVATAPFVCGPRVISDVDNNCQVDIIDYALAATGWGQTPPPVDLTTDGAMDFRDISQFAADWLTCSRQPSEECWQ